MHNPMAPPYDFIEKVFLPQLRRMGNASTELCVAFGARGLPAKVVANQAVEEARQYLEDEVPAAFTWPINYSCRWR